MLPFERDSALLAPMVGISNRAFRTVVAELGEPDWCWTEMASAEAFISHAQYEEAYTDTFPLPGKTSIQFFARSCEAMSAACKLVAERDPELRPAALDINFGCSAPHIRRMGGGSALSGDPDKAAALVAAARSAWPYTLSAKLRMGPDGDYGRLLAYCRRLCDAGLDFLTIHPRIDSQKFRRSPHWEIIGALGRDLSVPIVGNGDITGPKTFNAVLRDQRPYALMIGREAVRRPWLFRLIHATQTTRDQNDSPAERQPAATATAPSVSGASLPFSIDLLHVGLRFIELQASLSPPPFRLESARRFFSYYCDNFSFAQYLKVKLCNAGNLSEMADRFAAYFDEVPADRILIEQGA